MENLDPWIAKIDILQEWYFYSYRFFLLTYFLIYQDDFEFRIKLEFTQDYGTKSLRKTFSLKQIIDERKASNNKKEVKLKQKIQYTFQEVLKLMFRGKILIAKNLACTLSSRGIILYT